MVCVLFVVLIYGMLTEDGHVPLYVIRRFIFGFGTVCRGQSRNISINNWV